MGPKCREYFMRFAHTSVSQVRKLCAVFVHKSDLFISDTLSTNWSRSVEEQTVAKKPGKRVAYSYTDMMTNSNSANSIWLIVCIYVHAC